MVELGVLITDLLPCPTKAIQVEGGTASTFFLWSSLLNFSWIYHLAYKFPKALLTCILKAHHLVYIRLSGYNASPFEECFPLSFTTHCCLCWLCHFGCHYKYHRLGGLNKAFFPSKFWRLASPRLRSWQDLVSSKFSLPSLQTVCCIVTWQEERGGRDRSFFQKVTVLPLWPYLTLMALHWLHWLNWLTLGLRHMKFEGAQFNL